MLRRSAVCPWWSGRQVLSGGRAGGPDHAGRGASRDRWILGAAHRWPVHEQRSGLAHPAVRRSVVEGL